MNNLSEAVRADFDEKYGRYTRSGGYLNADFSDDMFTVYYTAWYLKWIASEVRKHDTEHYMHINPHAIFETLPEYDFPAYQDFLTSLGASIHPSWHFGYFGRQQYSLGVSAMSDIIRSAAGENPFWITELQGGGVISSGRTVLCPTAAETRQWLWTGIGAGAEGVIFWSMNPRAAVKEGGECLAAGLEYPLYFAENHPNTLMRLLRNGNKLTAVIVNNDNADVRTKFNKALDSPAMIFGQGKPGRSSITVPANDVVVFSVED